MISTPSYRWYNAAVNTNPCLLHSVLFREDKIPLLKATNYTHSHLPFVVYWCLQLGGEQDSFKVLLLLFQKFTFCGQVLDATMHPAVSMS